MSANIDSSRTGVAGSEGRGILREAAKNTLRGGSLKIASFGHKLLTPTRFDAKNTYPPKPSDKVLNPP